MSGFTIDYFLAKFSAIPEEQWCTGRVVDELGRHDAFGHCGETEHSSSQEGSALAGIVWGQVGPMLAQVNDGVHPAYKQATPKQRVLALLEDIKGLRG